MQGGRIFLAALTAALCAIALPAQADRYVIADDRLIFDTSVPVDGEDRDIRAPDVTAIRDLLRDNPGIRVLELKSGGGGHYPAMDLASLVIDFELDTHVEDYCESSCVTVFLGGTKRTLARGARLGFHQLSWSASSIQSYYDDHKEGRNWDTPFDFAEWFYEDTQTETYTRLAYMIARGVDAEFAVQSIRKPDTGMWFPYRAVLLAAGVVTD